MAGDKADMQTTDDTGAGAAAGGNSADETAAGQADASTGDMGVTTDVPTVKDVSIFPGDSHIPVGTTLKLNAKVTLSNGMPETVFTPAWTVADDCGTVLDGLYTAPTEQCTAIVTCSVAGVTGTARVQVGDAVKQRK